jgi:DNA-binding NarL/FixJ family response regulator
MPHQVLIVEDHPMVAHAMANELRYSGDIEIVLATHEVQAIQLVLARGREWFRIFLDLDIPGARGLSLARKLASAGVGDRCCIVSATDKPETIAEAERLGLLGYIVKACPYTEFRVALDRTLAGIRSFPLHSPGDRPVRLSWRQEQLLEFVRQGMTSREMAQRVGLKEGTVNNCITTVLRALNATSRSHAVGIALDLGLLPVSSTMPVAGNLGNGPTPINLTKVAR